MASPNPPLGSHLNSDTPATNSGPKTIQIKSLKTLQWNCRNFGPNFNNLDENLEENYTGKLKNKDKKKKSFRPKAQLNSEKRQNLILFADTLKEIQPDLLLLQSVNLPLSLMPRFPDFNLVSWHKRKNKTEISTAIYLTDKLAGIRVPSHIKTQNDESTCACKIFLKNGKNITVNSAYFPSGPGNIDLSFFNKFKETDTDTYILAGDFNKHHKLWSNSPRALQHNDSFAQAILDSDLILLNDKSPTRPPDRIGQLPTAIDLTLASPSLRIENWMPLPEHINGSDHYPIYFEIEIESETIPVNHYPPKFDFDKANWNRFSILLEEAAENNSLASPSINIYMENIKNAIQNSAKNSIPMKNNNYKLGRYAPWWNEECKQAVQSERAANKKLYKNYTQENKYKVQDARQTRKKTIASAKLAYMQEYIKNNVTDYKDTSKLWRKVQQLRNKRKGPRRPLIFEGKTYFTDKDKADLLAKQIAFKSQNASLTDKEKQHRTNFETTYQHPAPDNTLPINQSITLHELNTALKQITKKDKAPGSDNIPYRLLTNTPEKFRIALVHFFNQCFQEGYVPSYWKQAHVVPLLKDGKLATDPDSYRPISLTPTISKVFERILNNRLEHFIEDNNILPNTQSGFRKFRSTTDNLVYLTEKIKNTLRKNNTVRYMTFFDVKKAFDKVWHVKLLEKLKNIGLSGNIYNTIRNMLSNRSLKVKYGVELSEAHDIHMGTPQGAVLSPTLFTLLLYDILNVNIHNNEILLFADDIAIISKSHNISGKVTGTDYETEGLDKHRKAITNLEKYMFDNGLTFSGEKTQFMPVTPGTLGRFRQVHITVDGKKIIGIRTVKYLGLYINCHLSWAPHFNHIVAKSQYALMLLRKLASFSWSKASKFNIDVAKSLIRSRISYGQECYFGATKTQLNRLCRLEAQAFKIALGLPNTASTDKTLEEIRTSYLEDNRRIRCAQYIYRTRTIGKHFIRESLTTKDNYATPKIGQVGSERLAPIRTYVRSIFYHCDVKPNDIEEYETGETPPSLLQDLKIFTPTWAKRESLEAAGADANIFIEENYKHYIQIYTDASVFNDPDKEMYGQTGIGAIIKIPEESYKSSYNKPFCFMRQKLTPFLSTYSAEMQAIRHMLIAIDTFRFDHRDICKHNKNVVILTDSLSVLQALKNRPKHNFRAHNDILDIYTRLTNNNYNIHFVHIPSHCGIPGNTRADTLAKEAALSNTQNIQTKYTRGEAYASINRMIGKLKKEDEANETYILDLLLPSFNSYPEMKPIMPPFNPQIRILYRKLKVKAYKYKYNDFRCACGEKITFAHFFNNCMTLQTVTKQLKEYMTENNLQMDQMLLKHDKLGWTHTELLCKTIYNSKYAYCF